VSRADLPFDLDHLADVLLGYQQFAAAWRATNPLLASPGSVLDQQLRAEQDLSCEWDSAPVARAVFIGSLQLLAAEQHLVALALILGKTDLTWPVVTLLRSILEASARAWWLLDPALQPLERVGRAMSEELYSCNESAKLPSSLRPNLDLGVFERSAVSAGLAWLPGNPPSVGARRPSSTNLTSTFVNAIGGREGEVRYRWSSGVVHGTVHGLMSHVRLADGSGTPELQSKVVATCLMDAALTYGHAFESLLVLRSGDVRLWHPWHSGRVAELSAAFDAVRTAARTSDSVAPADGAR
jgi:hypothetical protein